MNKSILINEYEGLLKDIINEYRKFFNHNNGYYNYQKKAYLELEKIAHAFEGLKKQKIYVFENVFEDDYDSILHAVDSILFEHMKAIFENVKTILEEKK